MKKNPSKAKIPKTIKKRPQYLKKIAALIGILLIIVCVIKLLPHRVDGHSMEPTLQDNDLIVVLKGKKPKRYSVVTLIPDNQPDASYVKRIIGMPGDKIWLDNNTLYINQNPNSQIPESNSHTKGEELPDSTLKVWLTKEVVNELAAKKRIPEGTYFVLGDNRGNSNDSRHFGLVKEEQLEGVVWLRYYPLPKFGNLE